MTIDPANCVPSELPIVRRPSFQYALSTLINEYSKENDNNTPDFILAEYIDRCLDNFTTTTKAREGWYGYRMEPGSADGCCIKIEHDTGDIT